MDPPNPSEVEGSLLSVSKEEKKKGEDFARPGRNRTRMFQRRGPLTSRVVVEAHFGRVGETLFT